MSDELSESGVLCNVPPAAAETNLDPLTAVMAVAQPREAGDVARDGFGNDLAKNEGSAATASSEYGELSWPDGFMPDGIMLDKFTGLAKKMQLSRESAQELAALYAELEQKKNNDQSEFIAKNNSEWLGEIRSHPEFGGANLQRTSEGVASIMRRFGTPLLLTQIRQMNVQNWPEMFYFLARLSTSLAEDCSPSGVAVSNAAKSTAQLLFPGLK